jgi:hypothetical protein
VGRFACVRSSGGGAGGLRYAADYFVSAGASGSGDGSFGNPWTPTQAKAVTHLSRDTYVCWLAGNGSAYQFAATASDDEPAWQPDNSGASGARIIHFAEKSGVHLTTPLTNTDRTELSHDGTNVSNGGPIVGAVDRAYIVYDGFVFNQNHAHPVLDAGVILLKNLNEADGSTDGCELHKLYIQGISLDHLSNHCAVWTERTTGFQLADCKITGFKKATSVGNHNTTPLIM